MSTKYCRYCQQTLPVSDFYQKLGSRDGLGYKCKACVKVYMAERYAKSDEAKAATLRIAEREATKEQRREAKRKRDNAASRAYYAKHVEKCRVAHRRYHIENRQAISEYHTEYRDAHRDELACKNKIKYLERSEKQKQKTREQQKAQYRRLKAALIERLGGYCYCCQLNDVRFLTIDHIHNDGYLDRRANGKVSSITYLNRLLRDPDIDQRIRLACYNCNCARNYSEGKVCPHQQ